VTIPPEGCAGATVVGYIHSHPGVNTGIPSGPDFDYARWLVDHQRAPENIGIYVAAQYRNSQTGDYQTSISRSGLADQQAARDGTLVPAWVNPDAEPCPRGS
jgi:hypothetical protein